MYKIGLIIVIVFLVLSIFILAQQGDNTEKAEITVEEVKAKMDSSENVFLLDVRTEQEFEGNLGHIEGAVLIPISQLSKRMDELEKHKDKEIIAICRSGNRSGIATSMLRKEGFNAINMTGGMIAYRAMEKKSENEEKKDTKVPAAINKDHQ